MIKLKFILFTLLTVMIFSCSQNRDVLVGKWRFKNFYKIQDLDSLALNIGKKRFSKLSMVFYSDKTYEVSILDLKGTWNYNKPSNTILLKNNDGNEKLLKVIKLEKRTLVAIFPNEMEIEFEKDIQN